MVLPEAARACTYARMRIYTHTLTCAHIGGQEAWSYRKQHALAHTLACAYTHTYTHTLTHTRTHMRTHRWSRGKVLPEAAAVAAEQSGEVRRRGRRDGGGEGPP